MLLTIAKITTLGAWFIFWTFILILKIINKAEVEPQFTGKSGKFSTSVIIIFFTLLYSLLWTNGSLAGNYLPANWVLALSFLGFITLIGGLSLAIWSVWTLGSSWSVSTAAPINLPLKQTGPYSFLRHPVYLAYLLIWLGSVLMFINPFGLLLGIFILIPALKIRVKTEEQNLLSIYGNAYKKYQVRTGNLFPKIW